jgi:hypothetical protein
MARPCWGPARRAAPVTRTVVGACRRLRPWLVTRLLVGEAFEDDHAKVLLQSGLGLKEAAGAVS